MIARGRVTKPGRTITVCAGDVFARQRKRTASQPSRRSWWRMLATVMTVRDRPGVTD